MTQNRFFGLPKAILAFLCGLVVSPALGAEKLRSEPTGSHGTARATDSRTPKRQSRSDQDRSDEKRDDHIGVPSVGIGEDGITFRNPRIGLKLRLGGRLHVDIGGGEGQGRGLDEASLWRGRLRRGRIEISGTYQDAVHGIFQIEPFDRDEPLKTVTLGYSGFDRLSVTVGNMYEPFGLENLQSSNNITFIERALPISILPGRAVGAALGMAGERWSFVAGVFGSNINSDVDRIGTAVTARATFAPIKTDHRVLHLGASASYRQYGLGHRFEVSPTPESRVYDIALIGTEEFRDVRSLTRVGIEAAYAQGSFRVQGELAASYVERDRAFDDHLAALEATVMGEDSGSAPEGRLRATLFGGYLQVSSILTGQAYSYSVTPDPRFGTAYGVFGSVDVGGTDTLSGGGIGAWEIAARASFLDLDDLQGGREQNIGLGLNWYPEKNIRIMANAIRAFASQRDDEEHLERTATIGVVRLQIAF